MFGISPDKLALSPSSVLQNIIQEKQLAARERERATSERLALKRIAQTEAAAAEQARQFEISQAGRGALSEHQKWLQENWGKLTPAQQAEEARKAERYEAEKTARQQAIDETRRITEGLAEPEIQPTVEPTKQPITDLTTVTPEAGFEGLPDYLKRQPTPAPVVAPEVAPKVYTPPADIAGYLEQFPDRKLSLEEIQKQILPLKLTKKEKLLIDLQTLDPKDLAKSRRKSLIAQRKEISTRRTANIGLRKEIRNEQTAIRKEMKPKPLTYAQKTKIKAIKTDLRQGSYLTKGLTGRPVKNEIKSLNDAMGYIAFKGESPDKFTKELEKYGLKTGIEQNIKDEYNKLRASGIRKEEAKRRLGIGL